MFRTFIGTFVAVALTAAVAAADTGEDRKDLQVFNDISKTVMRYPQFSIFDSVDANVKDGVVTLTGKVTMVTESGDHFDVEIAPFGLREPPYTVH